MNAFLQFLQSQDPKLVYMVISLVAGGLISMRRRILENRLIPIPDLASPAPNADGTRRNRRTPPVSGGRERVRPKPAPSLSVGKAGRK